MRSWFNWLIQILDWTQSNQKKKKKVYKSERILWHRAKLDNIVDFYKPSSKSGFLLVNVCQLNYYINIGKQYPQITKILGFLDKQYDHREKKYYVYSPILIRLLNENVRKWIHHFIVSLQKIELTCQEKDGRIPKWWLSYSSVWYSKLHAHLFKYLQLQFT